MRFWDASAVVPLTVSEPHSRRLDEIFARGSLVVWWGTAAEVASALARRERSGQLAPADSTESFALLDFLAGAWREVPPSRTLRQAAAREGLRLLPESIEESAT